MSSAFASSRRGRETCVWLTAATALFCPCADPLARAQAPAAAAKPADVNAPFLDPKLDPESWVAKFEVESREVFAARDDIVAAVGLEPGDRIADVGAGTGVFLGPFAAAVRPTGRVYAVDISPRLVEFVERRIEREKLGNVAVVLSTEDSTRLAAGSVSHVFACDAYHHFDKYPEMLASIREALVPGGELVIVDFERIPGVTRDWLLEHVRADKKTVQGEIKAAGFEFLEEVDVPTFKENYLLRFRRPADERPSALPAAKSPP
jgi:ubiquinone/menaquinone biosynthesis C-methylase UbiE